LFSDSNNTSRLLQLTSAVGTSLALLVSDAVTRTTRGAPYVTLS